MVRLADVIAVLEAAYPPALAQDWDAVGLVCGDPDDKVESVLVAVDPVADDRRGGARRRRAAAAHPPPAAAARRARGRRGHAEGRARAPPRPRRRRAVHRAHQRGRRRPRACPTPSPRRSGSPSRARWSAAPSAPLDKIITFVPAGPAIAAVHDALAAAGAGAIGDYSHCSFATAGTGQFKPLAGAHPTIGEVGKLERVAETAPRDGAPRARRAAVVAALRAAHPYEEPAFDVLELRRPAVVARARPDRHAARARAAARLRRPGRRPALPADGLGRAGRGRSAAGRCTGSPSAAARATPPLGAARAAGVDAYVTADLRHHPASEHLLAGRAAGPRLVDVAHWASEWPWCAQAAASCAPRWAVASRSASRPGARTPGPSGGRRVKADPAVQRRLLDLADVDGELTRLAHRRRTLPEHAAADRRRDRGPQRPRTRSSRWRPGRATSTATSAASNATSRPSVARADRDQKILAGSGVGAKQATDLQHELETLRPPAEPCWRTSSWRSWSSARPSAWTSQHAQRVLDEAEHDQVCGRGAARHRAGRHRRRPRPGARRDREAVVADLPADLLAAVRPAPRARRHRRRRRCASGAAGRAGWSWTARRWRRCGRHRRTRWCTARSAGRCWCGRPSRACERLFGTESDRGAGRAVGRAGAVPTGTCR